MEKLEQHGGGDGLVRREENISGESELVGLLKGQDLLKLGPPGAQVGGRK